MRTHAHGTALHTPPSRPFIRYGNTYGSSHGIAQSPCPLWSGSRITEGTATLLKGLLSPEWGRFLATLSHSCLVPAVASLVALPGNSHVPDVRYMPGRL